MPLVGSVAWRAAVSAAASCEPRRALRLLEPRLVCRLVGGVAWRVSLVSLFVYSSLVSCAASWAAWRAAVSAAASSEPRLALRLLEPRLVCRLWGAWRGGRLSLPPPRVSLVSLFVYSSLVSCAASWAAWRGGRLSLPPPRVSLVSLFVYSSLVSCAASWAAWRECRLHAGVAPRHERICPSSGFIGMRGPSAPAPSTLRWDVRYCVALPLWRHATPD